MTDSITIQATISCFLMDFCFKMDCWSKNIQNLLRHPKHTSQDVKNMWKPNKGKMVLGKVVFKHHKLVSFQCKQFSSENQKDKEEDLT